MYPVDRMPPEISRQTFKVQSCQGTGGAVKLTPEKKHPANRTGKRVYTDGGIASLRLVWMFFWYKCGKIPAPLRQQIEYIARRLAFIITDDLVGKLKTINPATTGRYLKKDREALTLKGKGLTKPLLSLKSRIPIRAFYSGEERKTPGFRQIDTARHCGQTTSGQYILPLTTINAASIWICRYSLLNDASEIWCEKERVPLLADLRSESNKKTAPSSVNIWAMTGSKGLRNRPS
jgi:hypothetical protein